MNDKPNRDLRGPGIDDVDGVRQIECTDLAKVVANALRSIGRNGVATLFGYYLWDIAHGMVKEGSSLTQCAMFGNIAVGSLFTLLIGLSMWLERMDRAFYAKTRADQESRRKAGENNPAKTEAPPDRTWAFSPTEGSAGPWRSTISCTPKRPREMP